MLEELNEKQKLINNILHEYISERSGYEKIIFEGMKYSLFAGGKRLRPILLLAANELVDGKQEETYPFAAAIEMIHTYSLIHDDLPSMDNDDYRRGKLTNHKVYGEGLAVLAGDALLNYAYEIMLKACVKDNRVCKISAANSIANYAGISGMIGGQVVDIISEDRDVDKQELKYIVEHKTAALITAPLVAGAQLADATQEQINILKKYGYYLGMAFQVQDDILDVTSTKEVLGKNIQSDEKNNKKTYVSMYGLKNAKEYVNEQSLNAINCLEQFSSSKNQFLIALTKYLIDRNN